MKTIIILLFLTVSQLLYSQSAAPNNYVGRFTVSEYQNGQNVSKVITNAQVYNNSYRPRIIQLPQPSGIDSNSSSVRWTYGDPTAIGNYNAESGDGQRSIIGWYLNNQRTSAYGNTNNTPLWNFPVGNFLPYNYVAVSANGGRVANGFYHSIYLLNGDSGTATYTFDITTLLSTGSAGPVAMTSSGDFYIASINATTTSDPTWVVGFSSSSPNTVWRLKIDTGGVGGNAIQGIKISGNDSLAIINTYLKLWVVKTYTGDTIYSGTVNPLNNNGTQMPQGISGNGNIIATINYIGIVRVLQWNGTTYNLLWQHQEPPGTYYNWMSAVDVSYDGSLVAIGTLNFLSSSTYDGKIKLFSVPGGSTPLWTYRGAGDEGANHRLAFGIIRLLRHERRGSSGCSGPSRHGKELQRGSDLS